MEMKDEASGNVLIIAEADRSVMRTMDAVVYDQLVSSCDVVYG